MSRSRPLIGSMRALCLILLLGCGGPEPPQVCSNASPLALPPPMIGNPGLVVFDDVPVGATSTTTILLVNSGSVASRILAYGEVGPMNEGFTAIEPDVFTSPAFEETFTVQPGDNREVLVYHRPTDAGPDSGALTIAIEGVCNRTRIQLEGRGL